MPRKCRAQCLLCLLFEGVNLPIVGHQRLTCLQVWSTLARIIMDNDDQWSCCKNKTLNIYAFLYMMYLPYILASSSVTCFIGVDWAIGTPAPKPLKNIFVKELNPFNTE